MLYCDKTTNKILFFGVKVPAFKVHYFDRVKGTPPDLTIEARAAVLNCISIITQHYNSKQNNSKIYYQIKARNINGVYYVEAYYCYSKHNQTWHVLSPNDYLNNTLQAFDLLNKRHFKALASVG